MLNPLKEDHLVKGSVGTSAMDVDTGRGNQKRAPKGSGYQCLWEIKSNENNITLYVNVCEQAKSEIQYIIYIYSKNI